MASATYALGAVGTLSAVTVIADDGGDCVAVRDGGPGSAWIINDNTGARATVKINSQEAQSVFSTIAKSDVDAIVTAVNAAIAA